MALPIALPVRHSRKAPHFDPTCPSTLQDYLYDYELLAEAAQLTPEEQLLKCTRYLERDVRMDWETLLEFKAIPPDWKAFKTTLFRDYPDAREPEPSSAELDNFIEEHSTETSHPSQNLCCLIDSSDRLPIIYWPPTMFVHLKFRRHTLKAST